MNRRSFIVTGLAATLPLPVFAAPLTYKEGLVQDRLSKGETLFLDFKASWCGTCAAQERVLDALKAENPAYEASITFINIDWDEFRTARLTREMKIPRRSTLVVLKGDQELGRIVAQTSPKVIKGLMDVALKAATA